MILTNLKQFLLHSFAAVMNYKNLSSLSIKILEIGDCCDKIY